MYVYTYIYIFIHIYIIYIHTHLGPLGPWKKRPGDPPIFLRPLFKIRPFQKTCFCQYLRPFQDKQSFFNTLECSFLWRHWLEVNPILASFYLLVKLELETLGWPRTFVQSRMHGNNCKHGGCCRSISCYSKVAANNVLSGKIVMSKLQGWDANKGTNGFKERTMLTFPFYAPLGTEKYKCRFWFKNEVLARRPLKDSVLGGLGTYTYVKQIWIWIHK